MKNLGCGWKIISLKNQNFEKIPEYITKSDTNVLDLSYNKLTYFPRDSLPNGIKVLILDYNSELESLPEDLPETLEVISCKNCKLSNIVMLPSQLKYLDISNNFIVQLSPLPNTLKVLKANGNKLVSIPVFKRGCRLDIMYLYSNPVNKINISGFKRVFY